MFNVTWLLKGLMLLFTMEGLSSEMNLIEVNIIVDSDDILESQHMEFELRSLFPVMAEIFQRANVSLELGLKSMRTLNLTNSADWTQTLTSGNQLLRTLKNDYHEVDATLVYSKKATMPLLYYVDSMCSPNAFAIVRWEQKINGVKALARMFQTITDWCGSDNVLLADSNDVYSISDCAVRNMINKINSLDESEQNCLKD